MTAVSKASSYGADENDKTDRFDTVTEGYEVEWLTDSRAMRGESQRKNNPSSHVTVVGG